MRSAVLTFLVVLSQASCVCFIPVDELVPDSAFGATTYVGSNATWKITGSSPSAGWNSDAGFDDSSWGRAVSLLPRDPTLSPEADSVWDGPTITSGSRKVWLRKTFTLSSDVDSAALEAACNDDMEVWLNGTRAISDTDGVSTHRTVSDVRSLLVPGQNLVAASCSDQIPPEHAMYLLLSIKRP